MRIRLILLMLSAALVMAQSQDDLQLDRLAFSYMEGAWDPAVWLVLDASGQMVEVFDGDHLNLEATEQKASGFLKSIDFSKSESILDPDERRSLREYIDGLDYGTWTKENQHHTVCDHTIMHIRVLTENGVYHKHQLKSSLPSPSLQGNSLSHIWVQHFLDKKIGAVSAHPWYRVDKKRVDPLLYGDSLINSLQIIDWDDDRAPYAYALDADSLLITRIDRETADTLYTSKTTYGSAGNRLFIGRSAMDYIALKPDTSFQFTKLYFSHVAASYEVLQTPTTWMEVHPDGTLSMINTASNLSCNSLSQLKVRERRDLPSLSIDAMDSLETTLQSLPLRYLPNDLEGYQSNCIEEQIHLRVGYEGGCFALDAQVSALYDYARVREFVEYFVQSWRDARP